MPLVRVDVPESYSQKLCEEMSNVIYNSMVNALSVPKDDQFVVINHHKKGTLIIDSNYLGINRSKDAIIIQITLNAGRSLEVKKAFYADLNEKLNSICDIRKEDIFINLVEVPKENWSFGFGLAQYVD